MFRDLKRENNNPIGLWMLIKNKKNKLEQKTSLENYVPPEEALVSRLLQTFKLSTHKLKKLTVTSLANHMTRSYCPQQVRSGRRGHNRDKTKGMAVFCLCSPGTPRPSSNALSGRSTGAYTGRYCLDCRWWGGDVCQSQVSLSCWCM